MADTTPATAPAAAETVTERLFNCATSFALARISRRLVLRRVLTEQREPALPRISSSRRSSRARRGTRGLARLYAVFAPAGETFCAFAAFATAATPRAATRR